MILNHGLEQINIKRNFIITGWSIYKQFVFQGRMFNIRSLTKSEGWIFFSTKRKDSSSIKKKELNKILNNTNFWDFCNHHTNNVLIPRHIALLT